MKRLTPKQSLLAATDNVHPVGCRTMRTKGGVAAVQESIEDDPNQLIRCRSQQLGLCPSTLGKILLKDICLKALKI